MRTEPLSCSSLFASAGLALCLLGVADISSAASPPPTVIRSTPSPAGTQHQLASEGPADPTDRPGQGTPRSATVPFLQLRNATLGYHGPDPDLSNLPEIRIGWFGPTNTTHPTGTDLWCAANLALSDFRSQRPDSVTAQPSPAITPSTHPLPITDHRSPITDQQSPITNPQSPITNPQSPITRLRLIPRWSVDPWGTGVSQLARMVYQDQPLALLGSIDSATTHLAEQVVAKANLPLVSPIATDPSVTLAGVPWMFSCAPSDDAIARVLVDDLLASLGPGSSRLALLVTTDHESRMTTRAVMRELSRRQRLPDFRFDLSPGTVNLDPHRTALAAAQPDAALIIAGPDDAARLLRLLRQAFPATDTAPGIGTDHPARPRLLFGTHSMARHRFRELAGTDADGVRFPVLAVPDPADPGTAHLIERFTAERQHPPDDAAILTYDATRLLLEAIRQSGPSRARLRDTLATLGPWRGLSGLIHFDGTGQNTRTNVHMATLRHGSLVYLSPVSPPHALTAAPSLFP